VEGVGLCSMSALAFLPVPKGHLLATCEIICHHTSRCPFGASHNNASRNGGRTFLMKKLGKTWRIIILMG
jgi:hypothetical protein